MGHNKLKRIYEFKTYKIKFKHIHVFKAIKMKFKLNK